MHLTFSATNPCHMWEMACALQEKDALATYHSGYPRYKLRMTSRRPHIRCHSFRTLITYGLLRLPSAIRPTNRTLFPWQDEWFDKQVAKHLQKCEMIHAMPGQCLETFRRACSLGAKTVMNHATGPVSHLRSILAKEALSSGVPQDSNSHYDARYEDRVAQETALAQYHCCASQIVANQLQKEGVPSERIMIVPHAANPAIFYPPVTPKPSRRRVIFAGNLTPRKGFRFLIEALEILDREIDSLDVFGTSNSHFEKLKKNYKGTTPIHYQGVVPQPRLAEAMRNADILVLPSLEEGFGLVVPQALACGCACVVSDAVGAKDLLIDGVNGAIFRSGNATELSHILANSTFQPFEKWPRWSWQDAAAELLCQTAELPPN